MWYPMFFLSLSVCLSSTYLSDCLFVLTSQLVCTSLPDIRTVVQALIDVLGNPTELLKAHTAFPHSPGLATLVGRLGSASLSGTGGRGMCTVDLFCMPLNAARWLHVMLVSIPLMLISWFDDQLLTADCADAVSVADDTEHERQCNISRLI